MKIELVESLFMSYFKHVKKCQFYQSNWKVSSNWDISNEALAKAQSVYAKIIQNPAFFGIFNISEYSQLIKQSEIDIIGMDSENKIYMADVAFHEGGLSYGDKIETRDRVFKKLLRSYLTLLTYFPDKKYELIFASPKVNPENEKLITDCFNLVSSIFVSDDVVYKYISKDITDSTYKDLSRGFCFEKYLKYEVQL
jgi:hypothetical protein